MAPRPPPAVRALRERRGLTQQALAQAAGISRQALFAIESGRADPSVSLALGLAAALECKVEALFAQSPRAATVSAALAAPAPQGARVALAWLGERWVAHPLGPTLPGTFPSADGVTAAAGKAEARVSVELLRPLEAARDNVVLAGCDPALGLLADWLNRADGPGRFVWLPLGSTAALEALAAGRAHLAGTHLSDPGRSPSNTPAARRALGRAPLGLLTLARWETGLVVPSDRRRVVFSAADLARPGLRLVTRERGAAARQVLERALEAQGLAPERVLKTAAVARSHLEAAYAVAVGGADAAVAMRPAAVALGLGFVPLAEQRFDLVLPASAAGDARLGRLRDALAGAAFRREVAALGGYDVSECGREVGAEEPA